MDGPLVKIDMVAEKTVTDGHRIRTSSVAPGESLFYILNVRNAGGSVATNVVVNNPLPSGTVYVPGSASGKCEKIQVSVDGGRSYMDEHSGLLPETVTDVRWEVSRMPAGSMRKLEFQVRVMPRNTAAFARWLKGFYLWLASTLSR